MVFDAPPAQAVHAWMPSSPCGPGCVAVTAEVGTARVLARLLGVAGLLITYPLVNAATPRRRREFVQRRYAHAVLGCLGIELRVRDLRPAGGSARYAEPGQGVLIVAGHVSWADVVVMAAVQPLGFVARADMLDWPVLGGLARRLRVIPIERERLRELPGVVDELGVRLADGDRVAVFPEGTTWCGRAYGRMRPALFQAAVDTGTFVQPVRLRYLDQHGAQCTVPGFVGADTFADSAKRILRSRGLVAEVLLQPQEYPGLDRRDLARRCELAVRGTERSRHGGAVEWIEASTTRVQDPAPLRAEPEIATAPGHHGVDRGLRGRAVAVLRRRTPA
ncbi:lysophospholipid acyltransferase family protein [Nocardia sp. NPDC050712]|uniref:lysophospholipid acyltransferase family protein n=1 Tax=Nocardia sp. NPDC050712 TaxID=3155518 RepID=UPI003409D41C